MTPLESAILDPYGAALPVPVKVKPLWHHTAGLSYTASGYGARIPTEYMVQAAKRWRRVYCRVFSNSGSLYILDKSAPHGTVEVERAK